MFQLRRAMQCALGAMFLVFSIFPAAQAQTAQSWIPKLTRGQHVFVAPEIDSATRANFTSSSFMSEVENAGRSQNLDVYVIVTQTASDVGPVGSSGPALVRAVWANWTNHGFASDHALIILMTGTGGKFSSIGVRAGQYLNDRGINRDSLSADTGPVITAGRAYITRDYHPERVPAAIVQGVVQTMGPVKASFVTESPRVSAVTVTNSSNNGEGSMDTFTIVMIVGSVVLVGGLLLIVFWPRKRRDFESEVRGSASRGSSYGGSYGSAPSRGGSSPSPAPSSSGHSDNSTSNMLLGGIIGYELGRSNSESGRRSSSSDSGSAPAAVSSTPASSCSSAPSSSSCSSSTSSSSCSSSSGGSSCGGGGGSSCGGGGSF